MEDMNNPSHSMGVGQQNQQIPTHTRPFFYVQPPSHPPSHPPYMYQWNMSPYGQYILPPSGLPSMRPYMTPYPYMQYPGYVIPQAPFQPMEYRRMYEPQFPQSAATYSVSSHQQYQQYQQYQQRRVRREMTSSEMQTEPSSDPVHPLIDSLVGLKAGGGPAGGKEPGATKQDAGVSEMVTPSSGFKEEDRKREHTPMAQRILSANRSQRRESQAGMFSDQTMAIYNSVSRQSLLWKRTPNDTWSVGSGVTVLPQDSSSIYDKDQTEEEEEEEEEAAAAAEEIAFLSSALPRCSSQTFPVARIDTQGPRRPRLENQSRSKHPDLSPEEPGVCGFPLHSLVLKEGSPGDFLSQGLDPPDPGNEVHILYQPVSAELNNTVGKVVVELSPRILRLPCDKVTTGMLERDGPLWYEDSSLVPPGDYLSSVRDEGDPGAGGAFYHSYYPPVCPDRQSVLSPSLDELSSRDELFSTDVEDQDLVPVRLLIGGKMATDTLSTYVGGGDQPDHASEENVPAKSPDATGCEQCLERCAACGTSLEEKVGRQGRGAWYFEYAEGEDSDEEEGGDEDEWEGLSELCPIAVSGRRPQLPSTQSQGGAYRCCPPPRRSGRRGCYDGYGEMGDGDQGLGHGGHPCNQDCYRAVPMSKADKYKGRGPRNGPSRPCNDRPTREGAVTSDQESWGSGKHRPQSWKPYNGRQEPARAPRRRPACRASDQQRHRRTAYEDCEEAELPSCTRGRGSTKRRGTRYQPNV
ncbi:bucky ball [Osmerus eperlanus]|uniref:bucky ball n=1 Tax=Osmerus eperlanus TaxID=29151 RepID=UPI002E13B38E